MPHYLRLGFCLALIFLSNVGAQQCSVNDQNAIARCADPLYEIGAFRKEISSQSFTWEFFARQTRAYFGSVCDAFNRFDLCIEPYRATCFYVEPVRSRYRTATEVLDFLCRDGYQDVIENFDCFVTALTRSEMMQCQSEMIENSKLIPDNAVSDVSQQEAVCTVMQDYMACVKNPIRFECGFRAWGVVREVIQRPTSIVMPHCTLSAAPISPSIVLFIFALFAFFNCLP